MTRMYSYNGAILPERPTTSGYQVIIKSGNIYALAISSSPWIVRTNNNTIITKTSSIISGYSCSAGNDKWESLTVNTPGESQIWSELGSASAVIWSNSDISSASVNDEGNVTENGGVVYEGTDPVLQETKVLQAYANKYTTNTYGATGIYVGAQVLDTATGRVTDISNEANYSFDVFQAPYAYLDENRQLFISEDCPYTGISVVVTWDELPGQKANIPTFIQIDSGGGSDGGGGFDPGGDDIIIDTSAVTDILISMYLKELAPGGHAFFEVLVTGTGNYSGEYTLELNGQESADTYLSEGRGLGNIWVAEDETADFVLLTATSVENPLIQTTEMLYIDQTAVVDPVATEEQLQRAYMQGYATAKAYLGKLKIVEGTLLSVDQKDTEEAPEDIPSQLRRAYWQGFMSGVSSLAGKGKIEQLEPEPVAYLYNGMQFSKIPEVEGKPHAVLTEVDGVYVAELASSKHDAYKSGSVAFFWDVFKYEDGQWVKSTFLTYPSGRVLWTNYDLYYKTSIEEIGGTLYMAASEPVPVYE